MSNAYQKLMENQCLSENAKNDFYQNLQKAQKPVWKGDWAKAVAVALCVLILIPAAVFAAENIFHFSVVEIITGNTPNGKLSTGFELFYPEVSSRSLSDFSEEIRTFDGYRTVVYDSWKEAEAELGITLINNDFLNDPGVTKQYAYNLKDQGIGKRAHCHVFYQGKDNQLYRVNITASYQYDGMTVEVRSTVTCEHPAISKEKEQDFHWSGILYENDDVEDIQKEEYIAKNGIKATIITAKQTGSRTTDYVAAFAANSASYRIFVSSYAPNRDTAAKNTLIKILEDFAF